MKKIFISLMCAAVILSGCSSMSNTGKGAAIGAGGGAALGAALGAIIGHDGKGAAIGAAIGSAVGAGTGVIIGKKMDKKAEEMQAALENAKVETVTDNNGLEAIKVTFDSGLLFKTGKYDLSKASKEELTKFAAEMKDLPDTDIAVFGHTDNTGSEEVNVRLSGQRANAVGDYLKNSGIDAKRIITEGKSFNEPIASNETAEGRAQNRRVEVFVYANEDMIKAAEAEAGN